MITEILNKKKACARLSAYSDNKNKDANTVNFKLSCTAQGGNILVMEKHWSWRCHC